LYAPNANAVPIFSGYVSGSYELFDADIDPVGILLDDGSTINSGQVKFELDPNKTSFFKFDFDKMTHSYEVGLLVSIEALSLLSIPKQAITINLTGPITGTVPTADAVPPGLFDLKIFSNPIAGGGTFDSNQFLSGWSYQNLQVNVTTINQTTTGDNNRVTTDSDSTAEGEGQVTGGLVSPGGKKSQLNGTGITTANNLTSVPEVPGPLPIFGVAAAFSYSRKLRRLIKESNLPIA
jgi:hypothetical protein